MLCVVAGKTYNTPHSQKRCKHCRRHRPGQEEGNVPFVEEAGFGKYSGDPQVIADTVSSWLASPETMESMKSAALAAARPSATLDIARDLADIAFATKNGKEKVLVRARKCSR
jgi:hypothetical protein